MAITNKKTLEKMKKKNLKSIRVDKDGKVTNAGKKASKKTGSIFESPRSKAIRLSTESGKANTAATKKMYAAESMFNTAKARDDAKVTPGKKRPFPEAKAAAEKAGKDRFAYEGRSFFTTKGAADNRDKKKTRIAPKGSIKKKSKLDADTVASYKKRIKYMKDRKAKGKNFSAKNLKELEAKLAAN